MAEEEANQFLFHKVMNPNEELQNQSDSSDSALSSSSSSLCSSTDLTEDASSSNSSSNFGSSNANSGPLYELSEIMVQLPIKRGLSRYYQGKSQSHTSLASVKSVEDLAKKVINQNHHKFRSKMKSCKSYTGLAFDGHKLFSPKASISKKASRGSFLSSNFL